MRRPDSGPARLYRVPDHAPESLALTPQEMREAALMQQVRFLRRRALPGTAVIGVLAGAVLTTLAFKGQDVYEWATNEETATHACATGTIEPGEGPAAGINAALDNGGFDRSEVAGVYDAAFYFSASMNSLPAGTQVNVALDNYGDHQEIAGVSLGDDNLCEFRNNPAGQPNQTVYLTRR